MEPQLATFNLRSSASDASAVSLEAVLSHYNSQIDELQSRACYPPADMPERIAWAAGVKEDSANIMNDLLMLGTDALQAAEIGIPDTMDVYRQVNAALMRCAKCDRLVNAALGTWSDEQAFKLGTQHKLEDVHPLLDTNIYTTLSKAVADLNAATIFCPQGYCVVYSASSQDYFVLYRSDMQHEAMDRFNYKEMELGLTWSEAAGRGYGGDTYRLGDVSRIVLKRAQERMSIWAAKEKTKEGYQFGDLYLKRLILSMCGNNSSMTRSEIEENSDRLIELQHFQESIDAVLSFELEHEVPS